MRAQQYPCELIGAGLGFSAADSGDENETSSATTTCLRFGPACAGFAAAFAFTAASTAATELRLLRPVPCLDFVDGPDS